MYRIHLTVYPAFSIIKFNGVSILSSSLFKISESNPCRTFVNSLKSDFVTKIAKGVARLNSCMYSQFLAFPEANVNRTTLQF